MTQLRKSADWLRVVKVFNCLLTIEEGRVGGEFALRRGLGALAGVAG